MLGVRSSLVALVVAGIVLNFTHDNRATTMQQRFSGGTESGLRTALGTNLSEPTVVNLAMDLVVDRNPPDSAIIFSSCPGSTDSLEVNIDIYRNLYVTIGLRASDGDSQVIKLMESASYGSTHRLNVEINLEQMFVTLTADGLRVPATEARPGRVLDLGRARILVCNPLLPEDERVNGFVGKVTATEMTLRRNSSTPSLRSLNVFLVLATLAFSIQLISSKKENERKNHQHHAK